MKSDFLKKIVKPKDAFTAITKGRFLAAFDAHYGVRPRSHSTYFAKVFIAAGACAAVMVSLSAYADTANVAADNPLYPLKRLSENVRIALAPKSAQAGLQATLAVRRAGEIQDLSQRKPSSTLIAGLSTDFDNAVSSSLGDISPKASARPAAAVRGSVPSVVSGPEENSGANSEANSEPSEICGRITSAIPVSAPARGALFGNAGLLARFEDNCGMAGSNMVSSTGNEAASLTPTSTIMVHPVRIPVPRKPEPGEGIQPPPLNVFHGDE